MGNLVGHVAPGFGFLVLGLWHLFNHIKLHALHPNTYISFPWFPAPKIRYLELFLIMAGSSLSIAMELFIGPRKHQPFDPDGTIPSNHLQNFEHSSISFSFLIYASFAIILDRIIRPNKTHGHDLVQLLIALAFGQELLVFHLHSADHMGVEGQYHLLQQVIALVSLATSLMGIGFPKSFLVSFVRSSSILFQGVWFMAMGFMLWTPGLIPKGCFMNMEVGHNVVRCSGEHTLHRAKSLVNLQFSWVLTGVSMFSTVLYLVLVKFYGDRVEYRALEKIEEEELEDLESQENGKFEEFNSFIHIGKGLNSIEMERSMKIKQVSVI